jgi:hypothetical protein
VNIIVKKYNNNIDMEVPSLKESINEKIVEMYKRKLSLLKLALLALDIKNGRERNIKLLRERNLENEIANGGIHEILDIIKYLENILTTLNKPKNRDVESIDYVNNLIALAKEKRELLLNTPPPPPPSPPENLEDPPNEIIAAIIAATTAAINEYENKIGNVKEGGVVDRNLSHEDDIGSGINRSETEITSAIIAATLVAIQQYETQINPRNDSGDDNFPQIDRVDWWKSIKDKSNALYTGFKTGICSKEPTDYNNGSSKDALSKNGKKITNYLEDYGPIIKKSKEIIKNKLLYTDEKMEGVGNYTVTKIDGNDNLYKIFALDGNTGEMITEIVQGSNGSSSSPVTGSAGAGSSSSPVTGSAGAGSSSGPGSAVTGSAVAYNKAGALASTVKNKNGKNVAKSSINTLSLRSSPPNKKVVFTPVDSENEVRGDNKTSATDAAIPDDNESFDADEIELKNNPTDSSINARTNGAESHSPVQGSTSPFRTLSASPRPNQQPYHFP